MSDLSSPEEKAKIAEEKYHKGVSAFNVDKLDDALMHMRSALAYSPGNWKYHYNIGYVYWQNDQIEVAINHYKLFVRYAEANDPDIKVIRDRIKYLELEVKKRLLKRKLT